MELVLTGDRPLATSAMLNWSGGPDALAIDATNLSFACPLDLVGIVATAHLAVREGMAVSFKMPTEQTLASYLQRMDVPRRMPREVEYLRRISPVGRSELPERLLEVTHLTKENASDVADRVGRLVTGFYADSAALQAVFAACGELLDNAVDHGHSPAGAFIAIQTYSGQTTEGRRLEIAVCDLGIGVLSHLKQNPKHGYIVSDDVALQHAIRRKVSGVAEAGRGFGLYDLVTDARKHGSLRFEMRSGHGELAVSGTAESVRRRRRLRSDHTSGTWAWLTHTTPPTR